MNSLNIHICMVVSCFFAHSAYQMGENLFKSSKMLPWSDVVTAWHNEVDNYNYSTGSTNGKSIGHYTQVN